MFCDFIFWRKFKAVDKEVLKCFRVAKKFQISLETIFGLALKLFVPVT